MLNKKELIAKLKTYAKEIAIFVVVMTIFANAVSFYKSQDLNSSPLTLTNITLLNGVTYNLDETKPILIHFWATWCPTCKVEASNIQSISKEFNVLTVAVKSGSDEEIEEWLKESEYSFNVVNDNSGFLASHFKIGAYPTTFIYNSKKELVFSEVGYTSTIGLWLRMNSL